MPALHLNLENITKTYNRDQRVLENLCLDIPPGIFAGVRGPSGSGKSTLARIAAGLEKPGGGTVRWDGADIRRGPQLRRRGGRVQFLPQNAEAALNPLKTVKTLLEEVCDAAGLNRDRIFPALDRVELSRKLLGYRPSELSGGMNQRLLFTRILLGNPDCLILDEPGSGLDASAAAGLYRLIKGRKEEGNVSCLIISHEREVLNFLCDRIFLLEDRRLKG
jgi:peptide/nickel transport system ATP-binding protein